MELDSKPFTEVFMIPLSTATVSATSGAITWSKISCNRLYELRRDGALIGKLTRPSIWSQKFVAETQIGSFTFRRCGFLGIGAEILNATSGQALASFKGDWGSRGVLTFAGGQAFHLACKGWWRPLWTVSTQAGQPIFFLHPREKKIDLATGAEVRDEQLSILILFAWYRVLQAEEEAASVAVMAAVG
jgi:hypothetical protein